MEGFFSAFYLSGKKLENEILIQNSEQLKDKIYLIRGVQVMLDSDLAEIYGYSTKAFNQQVKNNLEKFDEDFMFQLTKEEYDSILRSSFLTLEQGKYSKYLPYAFTEQGVYMLMTVLKGELATKQSKTLVRLFKQMKDYVVENQQVVSQRDFLRLSLQTADNAQNLVLFKNAKQNVAVTVFSDNVNNGLHKVEFDDFCKEFPGLKIDVRQAGGIFHDRYIFRDYNTPDEKIYHCGSSSKDGGRKVTTITLTEDSSVYRSLIAELLKNKSLVFKK